ncbi:glutathione S-transferase family protein [Neptunomonas qingdaonensis]|uniref:Glutathione S-transferase n=1 Tax=Neptunomonas qingdaonensis TaxID=1045558 RepID=A0A1I2SEL7_9GAMM|nr:glutathione S-transferase [Neptunomonas qingdaonensis]SFG48536.1 glutathione S-transferase [Neptunomonas qingdaonensis]
MKLYDLEPSGNCYKVRLFAALAQIDVELEEVDFLDGAHKRPPVIDLNPLGQVPVLVDGDVVLRDSQAILVYLARQYGGHAWWPEGAAQQGEVMQWLSIAANEIQNGPGAARLVDKFGIPLNKPQALAVNDAILPVLEAHLSQHDWLALGRPTIADIAVFPYVALAHEGGIDLSPYTSVLKWFERIKALDNFIPMSGI